jgi:hypothetical protein
MSQKINLKEIERKSWTSYFQDGFYDIFMGLLMLGMGLILLFDANDWYIAVIWLGLLILIIGRRLITIPRVGRVKFGPERRIKQKKGNYYTPDITYCGFSCILCSAIGGGTI